MFYWQYWSEEKFYKTNLKTFTKLQFY